MCLTFFDNSKKMTLPQGVLYPRAASWVLQYYVRYDRLV